MIPLKIDRRTLRSDPRYGQPSTRTEGRPAYFHSNRDTTRQPIRKGGTQNWPRSLDRSGYGRKVVGRTLTVGLWTRAPVQASVVAVRSFGRTSRQIVATAFLLVTLIAGPIEAVAGQLSLTWLDNSTNELGFSVERSTGATGAYTAIASTGPGVTTYTDLSVADAMTYCYRVRAFNTRGYSNYTAVACGTTAQAFGLSVVKVGLGDGTVTSAPSGIDCGTSCSGSYGNGTAVTLTAVPATGSTFVGWGGGGCGSLSICTVTLTAATTVTATFAPPSFLPPFLTHSPTEASPARRSPTSEFR